MEQKLYNSCGECKQNCCKFGPGPYKVLPVSKFLENYSVIDAYNTRCANLTEDLKCSVWGTNKLPVECRTHVCSNKAFSPAELKVINAVTDEVHCPRCKTKWVIDTMRTVKKDGWLCENCGHHWRWVKQVLNPKSK